MMKRNLVCSILSSEKKIKKYAVEKDDSPEIALEKTKKLVPCSFI